MRVQATENFSWDVAAFVHDYDNVILGGPPVVGFPVMGLPLPVVTQPIINADNVRHYGFEFFTNWEVTEAWRLYAAYSMLQMEQDVSRFSAAPRNIFLVQSGWDLGSNWKLDVIWRYVDTLYRTNIPSYNVADVRIAWQPRPHTELFLVGRNLFQPSHFEFANDTQTGVQATEVQHEIYGGAAFRY
jgi:outer membrane receptor protein involved in Fe transport